MVITDSICTLIEEGRESRGMALSLMSWTATRLFTAVSSWVMVSCHLPIFITSCFSLSKSLVSIDLNLMHLRRIGLLLYPRDVRNTESYVVEKHHSQEEDEKDAETKSNHIQY